jgi:uncharacterized protein
VHRVRRERDLRLYRISLRVAQAGPITSSTRALPILQRLSPADCLALLQRAPVGRVGVSIEALPAVLPVNFVLVDSAVVFRTVPGTKLDAATAGAIVAFEVDSYEPDGTSGWSVMVQGRAEEVSDPTELSRLRATPLRSWALDETADRFVRIEASLVSGRRFHWMTTDRNEAATAPPR